MMSCREKYDFNYESYTLFINDISINGCALKWNLLNCDILYRILYFMKHTLVQQYHFLLKGSFVAAFGSTSQGDVSPNTKGAKCIDTGLPCDFLTSSCNKLSHLCIAFGPGKDMVDSTRIIGQKQLDKAWVSLSFFITFKFLIYLFQ